MKQILPTPLPADIYTDGYMEVPHYNPHKGATEAGFRQYETNLAAHMRERIISEIPEVADPVPVKEGEWRQRYRVPDNLKCIPFHRDKKLDPITGRVYFQITFPDGWGDRETFHASVSYNYIPAWNPGIVSDSSLLLVIAMNVNDPENGDNRVYLIRQDGKEAYCLMTHCKFDYSMVYGVPYIHAAPVGWLNSRTVFICQKDGVNCTIDILTGTLTFLPGMPTTITVFGSPDGRYLAFTPLPKHPYSRSFGHSTLVDHSAQLWIYDIALQKCRKIFDNRQLVELHPEFHPEECELTWYCGNFQWSHDGAFLNFFTMSYYQNRAVRDLCLIEPDGSKLSIAISSEDTLRFPADGKPRRFGDIMPSGSILNNHQAILPNNRQILCCTQDPFALPPDKTPNPVDPFLNTRFLLLVDLDRSRLQILQGDDLNFDGHPTCNPQQTLILGSDYNYFIKVLEPRTAHVTKLFSLAAPPGENVGHPHETWSPDGKFILYRREGKNGELFSADVSDLYLKSGWQGRLGEAKMQNS